MSTANRWIKIVCLDKMVKLSQMVLCRKRLMRPFVKVTPLNVEINRVNQPQRTYQEVCRRGLQTTSFCFETPGE